MTRLAVCVCLFGQPRYGLLHKSVMEREAAQLLMDPRVLHLSEPELETIRFVGEAMPAIRTL